MKKIPRLRAAVLGSPFIFLIFAAQCSQRLPAVYVPIGSVAKVSDGDLFGLREAETPFADSPTALGLWMTARGIKDMPAIESMVISGRIIFVPYATHVDVLEHDEKEIATKVRIRGGAYIGREVWTHPKFLTTIH
jgi:hypothetical protein